MKTFEKKIANEATSDQDKTNQKFLSETRVDKVN